MLSSSIQQDIVPFKNKNEWLREIKLEQTRQAISHIPRTYWNAIAHSRDSIHHLEKEMQVIISKWHAPEWNENMTISKQDTDNISIRKRLLTVLKSMEKLKHMLSTPLDEKRDKEELKQLVKLLEDQFSKSFRYFREMLQTLLVDEAELTKEMLVLEKELQQSHVHDSIHPLALNGNLSMSSTIHKKNHHHQDQEEETPEYEKVIKAFDRFLKKNGGATGGWDEAQHTPFVQIWNQYFQTHQKENEQMDHEKINKFLVLLEKRFPLVMPEDLKMHCEWYWEYLSMYHQHKEAIKQWKEEKKKRKASLLEQADVISDSASSQKKTPEELKEEEERLKREQAEKERKRQEVNTWKQMQMDMKLQQEMLMQEQQDQERLISKRKMLEAVGLFFSIHCNSYVFTHDE